MKSFKALVWISASAGLGTLALVTLAPGRLLARGPAGIAGPNSPSTMTRVYGSPTGLNALSTTPFGTQITPTNQGPVGGRPPGVYGSLLSQPVPNSGIFTNSVNGMSIRNVPYTGPSASLLTSPGFTASQFNGSGSAAGLRPTSFYYGTPGPIMLPQSLGNPEQNSLSPSTASYG